MSKTPRDPTGPRLPSPLTVVPTNRQSRWRPPNHLITRGSGFGDTIFFAPYLAPNLLIASRAPVVCVSGGHPVEKYGVSIHVYVLFTLNMSGSCPKCRTAKETQRSRDSLTSALPRCSPCRTSTLTTFTGRRLSPGALMVININTRDGQGQYTSIMQLQLAPLPSSA